MGSIFSKEFGLRLPLVCRCTLPCFCFFSAVITPLTPAFAQDNPPPETPPFPKVTAPPAKVEQAPNATPGKVQSVQLPSPLTLAQAIEIALRLQPDIAGATANREASEQREKQTQSRYFPSITPQFTYLNQYTLGTVNQFVGGTGGVIPVQQGSTSERRQGQLGLNYRLFDNGVRELNARQSRQNLRSSEYSEANVRQATITTVAENYFSSLRTAALVTVSQAQVTRAQQTLDVINAQVQAGVAAQKDTYQAQADLLNAQVGLLQARNNAAVAQSNLKNAIGVVGGESLQLADVAAPEVTTPTTAVLDNNTPILGADYADADLINRLSDLAYRNRPDIAQSQQNVESSLTSAAIANRQTGLQIAGDLSASNQLDTNNFDRSVGNNRQFNLGLSYPLFDGGLVRAQYRAAQANARVQEAQLTGLRQQVAVEVEQAYRTLSVSRASLPAVAAAQQAAQINYNAAIASRQEGVGTVVDVITAQTQLVQAQTNYVQAVYDFYTADSRLARAVGQADRIAQVSGAAVTPPATGATPPTPPQQP